MTTPQTHRSRHWRKQRIRQRRKQDKRMRKLRNYIATYYKPGTQVVVACVHKEAQ
jgi:hypothetical protein